MLAMSISDSVQAQTSKADVVTFINPDGTDAAGDVVGKARLHRSKNGVNLTIDCVEDTAPELGGCYDAQAVVFPLSGRND